MKVVINCTDADWPKIRWKVLDIINQKNWHGTVDLRGPAGDTTRMVERKCPSCAAFKAHRTMRKREANRGR